MPTKRAKRAAKREAKEREDAVRKAELARLEGKGTPANAAEFEALVAGSPDSSYAWIKYMAFCVSMGEVERARAVAERALETINYRQQQEKFNVWVAYINLENNYGAPPEEAAMRLFQRALPYNDGKKLHLAMVGVLEKSGRHALAVETLKAACKKYATSAKVWLRHIAFAMARDDEAGARKLLDRALAALPQRKHVKAITQTALLEFRQGSSERGRSLLEALLANHPRRTDLWSVYIDQEIKGGDHARIRGLFERAITLQLPPKKMKVCV